MKHLNVICLYRTGGKKYIREDVLMLHREVAKTLEPIPYEFICITDDASWWERSFSAILHPALPLGWWGKPFVFETSGPALYLDLDTVIAKGDKLKKFVEMLAEKHDDGIAEIWMLESFRWRRGKTIAPIEQWASGVMAWTGDWRWIVESFRYSRDATLYQWDQRFITDTLLKNDKPIQRIQDHLQVYSHSRHCADGTPEDADIVCFHGRQTPRGLLQ